MLAGVKYSPAAVVEKNEGDIPVPAPNAAADDICCGVSVWLPLVRAEEKLMFDSQFDTDTTRLVDSRDRV
jgi:hypothetical protein